jgi:hypothetical protein
MDLSAEEAINRVNETVTVEMLVQPNTLWHSRFELTIDLGNRLGQADRPGRLPEILFPR